MNTSIQEKVRKIDTFFRESKVSDEQEHMYARTLKLNEEVGELCEAILYEYDPNQRSKDKKIDLDQEIADVIIVSLLIAEYRKTDIMKIINQKLTKQLKRFNLE